ncbi:hypothetical protein [Pseudoalteromonas sp. S2755]|uniref:hypothetical protein n=1 Tax=Pseudoalteromonas sp. S2755 TaxID=2066523 RepID=UPI00110A0D73|nr:hypothetical protein [Pseudoalteromonas sp. S2755]TMN41958.1 hypothetical protein CWC03_07110 [Pseudoalteromonas sp. S2755]
MKIALYGINTVTEQLTSTLADEHELIYACTSGQEQFESHPTLSLPELVQTEVDRIIICSMFVDEIAQDLVKHGIDLEKIYFYNQMQSIIVACKDVIIPTVRKDKVLYAVFDLSRNVATFDCCCFAIQAELYREEHQYDSIHFVIQPKRSADPDSLSFTTSHELDDVEWRLNHIVIPVFEALPACSGVSKMSYRQQAVEMLQHQPHVFPESFRETNRGIHLKIEQVLKYKRAGIDTARFRPHAHAEALVDSFVQDRNIGDKKLLVITLREYPLHEHRNSPVEEWAEFTKRVDSDEFHIIVVRDTSKACEALPECLSHCDTLPLASIDMHIRFALYRRAHINMSINGGTSYTYFFTENVNSIMFIPTSREHFSNSVKNVATGGYFFGEQPEFRAHENQVVIWHSGTTETIHGAFLKLHRQIQTGELQDFSDLYDDPADMEQS